MHISAILLTHMFLPWDPVWTILAKRPTCHAQSRFGSLMTCVWTSFKDSGAHAGLFDELNELAG
jgi:hypothetical protein